MVRTHLDFAAPVHSPFRAADIDHLESVQRRATKQLPGFGNLSYPERLRKLKLPTLAYRRVRGDMIELFKALRGTYNPEAVNFIPLWNDRANRHSNRTNSLKIFPLHANNSVRKNSFIIRSAPIWNSLPETVVNAPTINTFKNRLDNHWTNRDLLYDNHRASIRDAESASEA